MTFGTQEETSGFPDAAEGWADGPLVAAIWDALTRQRARPTELVP